MLHTIEQDILNILDRISEERLYNIVFLIRSVFFVFLFVLLVIFWDSLPSVSPVQGKHLTLSKQDNYLYVTLDFSRRKMIDFDLVYTLSSGDRKVSEVQHVSASETSVQRKFSVPFPGQWCLCVQASWSNGLSLYTHQDDLGIECINFF